MSRSSTSASDRGASDSELVALGSAGGPGLRVVTLVFALILVGTAAIDLAFPRVGVKPLGPERREYQRLMQSASPWDGTAMRKLEYQHKLRSRVRLELGSAYAALRLALLDDAKGKVIVGEDGWLFHSTRLGVGFDDPDRALDRALALFRLFTRAHAAVGTKLIAVPVPLKPNVMAEHFPPDLPRVPRFDDRAIDAFLRAPHHAVDVRPALARLEGLECWWDTDSHWSHGARVEAAKAMASSEGRLVLDPPSRLVVDDEAEVPTDLLRLAGVGDDSFVRRWFGESTSTVYRVEGAPRSETPDLAVFGTSFGEDLASFVSHWTGEAVWDGHSGGTKYLVSLSRLVALDSLKPSTIWVEFPIYMLFPLSPADTLLDRDQGMSIGALPLGDVDALGIETFEPADGHYRVPEGTIVADPGLAALRMTGGDAARGTSWRTWCDGLGFDVPWLPMRDEVHLPLVDVGVLGSEFRVRRMRAPRPTGPLETTWVTRLDLGNATEGVVVDERTRRFDGAPIGRLDALHGRLVMHGPPGEVTVRARTSSGRTRTWTAIARNGATLLLDLGELAGESLDRVEVESETIVSWASLSRASQSR